MDRQHAYLCVCVHACMRVCMCVSAPRLLITSGVMWNDMIFIRLVKQVLQLLYGNYIYVYTLSLMGVAQLGIDMCRGN